VIENENQRLSLNVNTSLIVSELTMSDGEFAARTAVSPDRVISNKRELQGQSPYLVNAGMSYNIFEKDLEVGAYFNVQGRALQVIGVGQFPDVFTEPFNSLNANLSKSFGEKKNMSASLKLENLLNDKIESRFDYFGDKSFVFSSITPGINASLGFSYKF
jgi:outer membrane receptor protein involved in Fe transport